VEGFRTLLEEGLWEAEACKGKKKPAYDLSPQKS
jgi:hypothetical protein